MSNLTTQRNPAVPVIYKMAQRPGGVSSVEVAEALGIEVLKASITLRALLIGERLTMRKVQEGRVKTRYFADPAVSLESIDAARAAAHRESCSRRSGAPKGTKRSDVAKRMAEKHAAKRAITVRPARQPLPDLASKPQFTPIITSETKVTICPAPLVDHRYQVKPGEQVWGCGFAALRPGHYPEAATSAAARAVGVAL